MVSFLCPCRLADYQVAQVSSAVAHAVRAVGVAHAAPAVSSPADYQVAQVAVAAVVAHAALALLRVHPAAAVAPREPDVQLALREPDVRRVVVAQQHVHEMEVVRQVALVPRLAVVPLFVPPVAEARCLDARLAPGTSVP